MSACPIASIVRSAHGWRCLGVAFSPDTAIVGQLTANVHAQGPTSNLALTAMAMARNLEVTGNQIPQPVRVPAVNLTMTPQQIQSDNLSPQSRAHGQRWR